MERRSTRYSMAELSNGARLHREVPLKLIFLRATVVVLVIALLTTFGVPVSPFAALLIRGTAVILLAIILMLALRSRLNGNPSTWHIYRAKYGLESPKPSDSSHGAPTVFQAEEFSKIILQSQKFCTRFTESIETSRAGRTILTRSILLEGYRPSSVDGSRQSSSADFLCPVLIAPKGALHDNLVISGANSEYVSQLSYKEYISVLGTALHLFFMRAYKTASSPSDDIPNEARTLELSLFKLASQSRFSESSSRDEAMRNLRTDLQALKAPNEEALIDAWDFAKRLVGEFPVVGVLKCDSDGRFAVRCSVQVTPVSRIEVSRVAQLAGIARLLLGIQSSALEIPIVDAGRAQTYNLTVQAPQGMYIARQTISIPAETLAGSNEANVPYPYYRMRRRRGYAFTHLYARDLPGDVLNADASLRIEFLEIPPGSSLRAGIAALAAMVLVWTISYLIGHTAEGGFDSDLPALLLAFPASAAAWLGLDSPGEVRAITFASRISLIFTTFVSLAGSVLFLLFNSNHQPAHAQLPFHWTFLGTHYFFWALLGLAATINAIYICNVAIISSLEFVRVAREPGTPSDPRHYLLNDRA
jgi:hypothetical protein